MKPITSIYIPRIESEIDANFIANVFDKNGIAQVSSIYIEPYKNSVYNRAYIGIKLWHDTESAFNFIAQLHNPIREARFVYMDDNWWPVYINKYPAKLASSKRVLTLFEEKHVEFYNDDISTTAQLEPQPLDMIKNDLEKTKLLPNIHANFQLVLNYKRQAEFNVSDAADFDKYSREIDDERKKWAADQKCIYSLC